MNVLSLFDGMSCGQQALGRAGFVVDNYYASEIDKHAIKVTMANYPNTIQLGSVLNVNAKELPKIDLLIGGSPCQSFSFAGKRKGMSTKDNIEVLTLEHYLELKSQNFEFEGQSYLFWEYMRILQELRAINPDIYFLLENVEMGEKWEKILSKAIGLNGIHINSALVSAQNRKRIYWTNIGLKPRGLFGDLESIIEQPKDRGILLKDILETDVADKYFISSAMINRISRSNNGEKCFADNEKSMCLAAGYYKQGRDNQLITVHNTMPRSSKTGKGGTGPLSRNDGKTYCLDTGNTNAIEIVAMRGRGENNEQQLEPRNDGKTNALTSVQKDNLVRQINPSKESGGDAIISMKLGRSPEFERQNTSGKNYALDCGGKDGFKLNNRIRRLTPLECMRLQTVADNYLMPVSDTQKYKMLGNGWNIETIVHILSYLNK